MSTFREFLDEETTSSDIAAVTTKLDLSTRHQKHIQKGKKCSKHKKLNCKKCESEMEDKWN